MHVHVVPGLGIPVLHACSAALKRGIDIDSLCIIERRADLLREVYEAGNVPVDIETIQPIPLEPPVVHRQAGRPKGNRYRRQNEEGPKRVYFCSICGLSGHNSQTCPQREQKVTEDLDLVLSEHKPGVGGGSV